MAAISRKPVGVSNSPATDRSLREAQSGQFIDYVCSVEDLLGDASIMDLPRFGAVVGRILDGEPSEVLRQTMDLRTRKETGAFFTGSQLSGELVSALTKSFDRDSRIFDPACGAGDLLLACSRRLPIEGNLSDTLEVWGRQLNGVDVYPEFVRVTRARLALAAAVRFGSNRGIQGIDFSGCFPGVKLGDGLKAGKDLAKMTHVIMNPPFGYMTSPDCPDWAGGRVSRAALFFDYVVASSKNGTNISAILPDVLRCGTRYEKWRQGVERQTEVKNLSIKGLFGLEADVDVFLLNAVVGCSNSDELRVNWYQVEPSDRTLGCMATVSVGPVVPHRHPDVGEPYPFLTTRGLVPGGSVEVAYIPKRGFSGTVQTPPFIAVRRTSRPDEKPRAWCTLILGNEPVAVENHLLIVNPMTKSREACERILEMLHDERTDQWLNLRMRCRHLTVKSLRELPLWT